MKKSKSVSASERLKLIKLNANSVKVEYKTRNDADDNLEEYPKLRKPKPETWLKIQSRQRTGQRDSLSTSQIANPEDTKIVQVPLREEFLNKKEELVKATTSLLRKYEVHKSHSKLLDDTLTNSDAEEANYLTLELDIDKQFKELDLKYKNLDAKTSTLKNNIKTTKPLNYCEQHLVNIFYTKVQAHPNGFFAENLPEWYKKTFAKDLAADWLEILKRSNKFFIEEVQNKTVLYTKTNFDDESATNIDLSAGGDKANIKPERNTEEILPIGTETSIGFVRYKHLQKSLKEYDPSAGRNLSYASKGTGNLLKPSDRHNKISVNKKYNFVKK